MNQGSNFFAGGLSNRDTQLNLETKYKLKAMDFYLSLKI